MGSRTVRARLDEESERALATLTSGGRSDSEVVREALIAAARRTYRRSALAAEAARLADDPVDTAERAAVAADMESLRPAAG